MPDRTYLIRFDDICPTMNWAVWEAIEVQLLRHGVKPLLAVVPDNQDPKLMPDPPRPDFWDRVRDWQARGWTIALHGYQHQYVNRNPGMLRLNPQSEFAGLSREEQREKLTKGAEIFAAQGVRMDAWIAPSHSFDRVTVELLKELGVPVISDGLWRWPFREPDGLVWVPQQLWRFQPRGAGVWTVCCHHNGWTDRSLAKFAENLASYAPEISDLATVVQRFGTRKKTHGDRLAAFLELAWTHRIRYALSRLRGRLRSRRRNPR